MKTIEYMRRKNLGHYEFEELRVSDIVKENEDVDFKILDLKKLVHFHLGISDEPVKEVQTELPIVEETPKIEEIREDIKKEVKEEKPKRSRKSSAIPSEKTEPKVETKIITKGEKFAVYDRTINGHKVIIGRFLDEKYPKWRSSESILNKASNASKEMNGKDFLDSEGEVLDSFKTAFAALMDN